MTDEQRRAFARALGLPEDTTEARLHEVAAERAAATPAEPPTPAPPETPPATPQGDPPQAPQTDPPAQEPPQPSQAPPQQAVPEGMRLVDEAALAEIRQQAEQGAAVAARMARQDRDTIIRAAISDGKFSPARREHFERLWERDPDGTRTLLTAAADKGGLERGMVPVTAEIGASGDGEGAAPTDEGTGWFNFDKAGA